MMKRLGLIGLAGLTLCFIPGAAPARADELTVNSLVDRMVAARNAGKWGEVMAIGDQVLARSDASKAIRAQVKLCRVDSLAALGNPPEKVAEEFAKLGVDGDFTASPYWAINLRLDESQYLCGRDGFEEKGIKVADDGIALIKKAMEISTNKPDNGLWDRLFLTLRSKIVALRALDRQEDAAASVYSAFKEADSAGVALNYNNVFVQLNAAQYFLKMSDRDKYLESAALALSLVSRTRNSGEVKKALDRFSVIDLPEAKVSASPGTSAKLKEALLAVARIPFQDKGSAAAVIEQAKALAEKF